MLDFTPRRAPSRGLHRVVRRGVTIAIACGLCSVAPEAAWARAPREARASRQARAPRGDGALSRYLQRPVRYGAHFVDHGVLQVDAAGGWPHLYRLGLSLGLLDHFTLGATAHWLASETRPKISPTVAVAFYRSAVFETGMRYFWSLYPPPLDDLDPTTVSFQQSAHWILGTASFGQRWLTGGFDVGTVRARVRDPGQDPTEQGDNPSVTQWRFGGGLHLRAGTRRWGFTAQVLVPHVLAELRLDVRFGLFEKRTKGGWRPRGVVEDWDRPVGW